MSDFECLDSKCIFIYYSEDTEYFFFCDKGVGVTDPHISLIK